MDRVICKLSPNSVVALVLAAALLSPGLACSTPDVLQGYIDQALTSNLALRQEEFALKKSMAALAEARGLFLPSIGISGRYTRAGGGRTIDFPVGDIVNPIHEALNDLIGQPVFPTNVENVSEPLLREKEQESKIQVTQPVFQPSVYFNYRIRSSQTAAEEAGRDMFRQQLVRDVKTAYYNYLMTLNVADLYEATETLLRENLRVSQSLYDNGKATRDVVFRARAELSKLEQEKAEADRDRDLARSYFNFLLNRPHDEWVEPVDAASLEMGDQPDLGDIEAHALNDRYELKQLEFGIEAAKAGVRLAKTGFLPGVVLAADYGYQGEEYRFDEDHDFWTGSLVLEWTLFDGLQRRSRIGQARAERDRLETRLEEARQLIKLEVREAYDDVVVARKSIGAARDRLASSQKTFDIVSKKYGEGMAAQIEYLDAQTTLKEAEINLIVTTYDYHIKMAELERAAALYPLE
jgi:outer membrane protein TolC